MLCEIQPKEKYGTSEEQYWSVPSSIYGIDLEPFCTNTYYQGKWDDDNYRSPEEDESACISCGQVDRGTDIRPSPSAKQ